VQYKSVEYISKVGWDNKLKWSKHEDDFLEGKSIRDIGEESGYKFNLLRKRDGTWENHLKWKWSIGGTQGGWKHHWSSWYSMREMVITLKVISTNTKEE